MNSRDIRRKYGQNYLTDPAILFEMDEAISPKGFDNFIELGPGHGALTNQINRENVHIIGICLLYTSPSPRDRTRSRMPSSA